MKSLSIHHSSTSARFVPPAGPPARPPASHRAPSAESAAAASVGHRQQRAPVDGIRSLGVFRPFQEHAILERPHAQPVEQFARLAGSKRSETIFSLAPAMSASRCASAFDRQASLPPRSAATACRAATTPPAAAARRARRTCGVDLRQIFQARDIRVARQHLRQDSRRRHHAQHGRGIFRFQQAQHLLGDAFAGEFGDAALFPPPPRATLPRSISPLPYQA